MACAKQPFSLAQANPHILLYLLQNRRLCRMSSGIFGPRGPSYSYYTNNYATASYINPRVNPYHKSSHNYSNYVNYANGYPYPNYSQYPYTSQLQISIPNLTPYSWGKSEVTLPSKGLESILVAILTLVVLDLVFVRPLKNSPS